jgi:hypothetical protein
MISAKVVRESRLHLCPNEEFVWKVCCCRTADDAIFGVLGRGHPTPLAAAGKLKNVD